MITVLASPKAFKGRDGDNQRRAIQSWRSIHPEVEVMLFEIRPGARGIETGPAALNGVEQRRVALNIEKGFILAGHRGFGQVLGRGGGANSHDGRTQGVIGGKDGGGKRFGNFRFRISNFGSFDLSLLTLAASRKGLGRDHETLGHRESRLNEAGQIQGFATYERRVVGLRQRHDQRAFRTHRAAFPAKHRIPPVSVPT